MLKDVVAAEFREGHRIFVRFEDGVEGEVDLGTFLRFEGVFAPLADPARFRELSVNAELGTVCWPNGADIAPEVLYALLDRRR